MNYEIPTAICTECKHINMNIIEINLSTCEAATMVNYVNGATRHPFCSVKNELGCCGDFEPVDKE